jgi:tRNA uridine 5-carbamoylmethylation protein Kti12
MNTAIIITGTVCSGKSCISEKIQENLNAKLITELNSSPENIFGIIHVIKNSEDEYIAIIEHAEILKYIDDTKNI